MYRDWRHGINLLYLFFPLQIGSLHHGLGCVSKLNIHKSYHVCSLISFIKYVTSFLSLTLGIAVNAPHTGSLRVGLPKEERTFLPEASHLLQRDEQSWLCPGDRINRHKFMGVTELQCLLILCSAGCTSPLGICNRWFLLTKYTLYIYGPYLSYVRLLLPKYVRLCSNIELVLLIVDLVSS